MGFFGVRSIRGDITFEIMFALDLIVLRNGQDMENSTLADLSHTPAETSQNTGVLRLPKTDRRRASQAKPVP